MCEPRGGPGKAAALRRGGGWEGRRRAVGVPPRPPPPAPPGAAAGRGPAGRCERLPPARRLFRVQLLQEGGKRPISQEEGDAVASRALGSPLHGTTLKRGTVAQADKLRQKRDYRNPFKTHTTNTATASNASFTRADLRV
ncbi:uncharacterized protein LOC128136915 isoform X2 [Harpia harpyja]|uniref:uncharacterized protein LOC128136915 isoform X2 n=1 Tax=Harpia harpyja TaxID=202280 RepID=UPI0022B21A5C|nr:uncharacterized protein LOC128136915 isoform X2 [Harpia harpyja]